jgi:hypothetical protein
MFTSRAAVVRGRRWVEAGRRPVHRDRDLPTFAEIADLVRRVAADRCEFGHVVLLSVARASDGSSVTLDCAVQGSASAAATAAALDPAALGTATCVRVIFT